MRILFCDDDPERKELQERILAAWEKLKKDDHAKYEKMELETCSDILKTAPIPDGTRRLEDLGVYDGFLLDIIWDISGEEKDESHGITIAEMIREKFPEKPIIIFTCGANPAHFNELLKIGICGYLSKTAKYEIICSEIANRMDEARKSHKGQCLYKHIRNLTSPQGTGWSAKNVGEAASKIWQIKHTHERWEAFWNEFAGVLKDCRLHRVFAEMKNFFAETDLLTLGAMPKLRGHLDHVLNVYFTGYVISNSNPLFKKYAISAASRLFPAKITKTIVKKVDNNDSLSKKEQKEVDYFWGLFQLAWLAAATLHDTAYPLEIISSLYETCNNINDHFKKILSPNINASVDIVTAELNINEKESSLLKEILAKINKDIPFEFILEHSTFGKEGKKKINHGVAGGISFFNRALPATSVKGQPKELKDYVGWAAIAIALHSLKIPGHDKKISISLEQDPLSYLLMACDEIQVWERERPDENKKKTPFKSSDLIQFDIDDDKITAEIDYILHPSEENSESYNNICEKMNSSIEKDGEILGEYLKAKNLTISVKRRVLSKEESFSELCF